MNRVFEEDDFLGYDGNILVIGCCVEIGNWLFVYQDIVFINIVEVQQQLYNSGFFSFVCFYECYFLAWFYFEVYVFKNFNVWVGGVVEVYVFIFNMAFDWDVRNMCCILDVNFLVF